MFLLLLKDLISDFYLKSHTFTVGVKKNVCSKKIEKMLKYSFLHLWPQVYLTLFYLPVCYIYQIFLHFWLILLQNARNFESKLILFYFMFLLTVLL